MTTLREAAQQALEALGSSLYPQPRQMAAITALRAALAAPVPHGCHVYCAEGAEPDGCVLDEGRPENCIYAKRLLREGKDKTACKYWQPIEVKK